MGYCMFLPMGWKKTARVVPCHATGDAHMLEAEVMSFGHSQMCGNAISTCHLLPPSMTLENCWKTAWPKPLESEQVVWRLGKVESDLAKSFQDNTSLSGPSGFISVCFDIFFGLTRRGRFWGAFTNECPCQFVQFGVSDFVENHICIFANLGPYHIISFNIVAKFLEFIITPIQVVLLCWS